ncbi:TIGR04279 domain-containing protein [Methanosarcina sp. KYL-1]|uniref:TIGR04279 domain-containing protein n=1 Tax=Methanosarcina sp. KYL-1 TaxID=2602068 RepID=UPI002100ADDE|nr:TIGR04279 domain-containing protein [Methanosarcina sp. KYL-1]MCQ1535082.1 TIGR04279 domain-containing protein [Methanosarcina sp. KYL-1]
MAKNSGPIANLTFNDTDVYFLDHTDDPEEGNWISLGSPADVRRIQLPDPIKFTYDGPKSREYGGVSATLNKDEDEEYTISYPYTTHPVYLPDENVTMSFLGESGLTGDVDIYLFKITCDSAYGLIDALMAGENIGNLSALFHDNMDGNYEMFSADLDGNGDLLDYDFGPLEAGQYCIVLLQKNGDNSLTALSATAFVVVEYELDVTAPENIVKGNDLGIVLEMPGASGNDNCTYGAVLIRDSAYKANIEIDSDGTKSGTSVIVNEIDIIEEFDINSSNYRSKLTKNELQTDIQTMIGEGKGTISIGEAGQNSLSLTTFDLPPGDYFLLAGVYQPGRGLIALDQKELEILNKGNKGKGSGSSGSGGGGSGSPEPASNVKAKELAQQFVSNGHRVRFEFTREGSSVGYVEFDARKTAGKITAIIEELKGKSSLTPTKPEGEIYSYLNIWVGNEGFPTPENIENPIVGFRVSRAWITENKIGEDSIVLQHFSENQWNPLPTVKVSEDEEYIYFEAETPGFSPFAITSRKKTIVIEAKSGEKEIMSIETNQEPGASQEPETTGGKLTTVISKFISFFVGVMIVIMMTLTLKKKKEP